MQDKLSYLSKYGDFSGDKTAKKTKKKKGKKKSKKREENATSLRDLDEDDAIHNSMGNDNMNDADDEPVICIPEGLSTSSIDPKTLLLNSAKNQSSFIPVNDSDKGKNIAVKSSSPKALNQRKNRYDSEEESDSIPSSSRIRGERELSSDSTSGYRKRRRTRRYDSEESDYDNDLHSRKQSRLYDQRHSSSPPSPKTRKKYRRSRLRHDSSSDEDEVKSSKTSNADITSTTYRDSKTGLKFDMENRYKNVLLDHQRDQLKSIELNKGKVQKEKEADMKQNREFLKTQSFARTIDDLDEETGIKNVIRAEDPMAMQAMKKQKFYGNNTNAKPIYKGPPAKPNRFNIKPGYRWDGVDRGNGFEDKILSSIYSQAQLKEDAYKWSTADM